MTYRARCLVYAFALTAFTCLCMFFMLGCGFSSKAQSSIVSVNGIRAQKPDLPLAGAKFVGTSPGQCLAVQSDGTVGGTACSTVCPSATLSDFGACANAATAVQQINFADGNLTTSSILRPQPGQVLHFGVGTYTLPQIVVADSTAAPQVRSNVITGQGTAQTTLQQTSTATGPVITNAHFSTLTGSNSIYGAAFLTLRDFTVNAGAASADCTVKIYGPTLNFRYITIQHGGTCNRYTEWAYDLRAFPPFGFVLSGTFDHVMEFDAKSNGVVFNGPLDSDEIGGQSYKNGGWAFYIQQALNVSYLQAIESDNAHPGSTGAIYVNGTGIAGAIPGGLTGWDVSADGNSGTMLYYGPNNGAFKLEHSDLTAGGANGLASNGLDIEGGFGNSFSGEIQNTNGTAVKINGGNLIGNFYMAGNTGTWFDFANEPLPSIFSVVGGDALGTAFSHMPGVVDLLSLVNIPVYGVTNDRSYVSTPGLYTRFQGGRFATPLTGNALAGIDMTSGASLPLNSVSGQRKVSFRKNGAGTFDFGVQDDGTLYVYDVVKGSTVLTVNSDGGLNLGEGSNSLFVQQNGSVLFRGGMTSSTLKATTGTRYVCVDTNGALSSSVTACSGT